MAAPKRKQGKDKTSNYSATSKKPKFGKESDKLKSAVGKKDAEFKKTAKPVPKRTELSIESDSDELDDNEEIKDDGNEGEKEVEAEGDPMDIDEASKGNEDGQSGCE